MKRTLALFLTILILLPLFACGTTQSVSQPGEMRVFIDSLGRSMEVPMEIQRVAVTGPVAQLMLFSLCPERLVGLATPWDSTAVKYLNRSYLALPVIGQFYGGKNALNLEALLCSGAEIILDVGEDKGDLTKDMDSLQEQAGIPVVHISVSVETTGDAYRLLGELLNVPEEAELRAAFWEKSYSRVCDLAENAEKVRAIYMTGADGSSVMAKNSYHSEIFDFLCDNVAVLDYPAVKGTGNEVGMEQLLSWDPDYIVFAPGGIYAEAAADPAWNTLHAIQSGNYCEAPTGPDNWMGFPPGIQRCLGMLWLGKLFYGDAADYDLYTEVKEFYHLFYHCDLTQAQFDALMENSIR